VTLRTEQRQLIAWVLPTLLLAVLWSGTVDRPATLVLTAVCGLLAVLRGLRQKPVPVSLFAPWLLLAVLWALFQCVPLPVSLRQHLPIGSAATLTKVLAGLGGGSALPVSLDPAETLHEATRLLGALSLLLAWSSLRSRHGDSLRLCGMVVLVAVLLSLLGLLSALGLPLPPPLAVHTHGSSRALWPAVLQNANHMAALIQVGAVLAIGMWLELAPTQHMVRKVTLLLSLVLLNLTLLQTLSRAGILCGLAAQLVTLLWADAPDRQEQKRRVLRWILPSLLIFVLTLLIGPGEALVLRLRAGLSGGLWTPGSKLWVWREALPLAKGHWLLGIGRGSLDTALDVAPEVSVTTRFAYLENEWIQTLLDYGLVVGLGLVLLLGLAMVGALRRTWKHSHEAPSPVRRSAAIALLSLGAHNLFDFSLATGALMVSALLLTTLIQKPRWNLRARWLLIPGLASLGLSLWVHLHAPSHEQDGQALVRLVSDHQVSDELLIEKTTEALRRHPLDSYLSAVLAARLVQDDHPDAMRWINRALTQHPSDLLARATAAQLLSRYGHRRQALTMMTPLLADADPEKRRWLIGLLLTISRDPSELLATLPDRVEVRRALLEVLSSQATPDFSLMLAIGKLAVQQSDPDAFSWLGRAALALNRSDEAEAALQGLLTQRVSDPLLVGGLLELLLRAGRADEADSLARKAIALRPAPELAIAHAQIVAKLGRFDEARRILQQAIADCQSLALVARLHEVRADVESQSGQLHRAAVERAEAARLRGASKQP
jgi:tetratricopeptide (TPR) repeat protein